MYLELKKRLETHLRGVLKARYDLDLENIPLETPPDLKFGELATPVAFELARKLRKAPKVIAQEIVEALGELSGFASFEVAGAGYINARIDRVVGIRLVAIGDGSEPSARAFTRWSSTRASIRTRLRISGTCATRFWATRLCGCCARPGNRWTCRTTSTTPACRLPMWWLDFCIWKAGRPAEVRALD